MISIIVVEDDGVKFGNISKAITDVGIPRENIVHVVSAADALSMLRARGFDLMVLDINLPRRNGEQARSDAGITLLSELSRDPEAQRPSYIVGLTSFPSLGDAFGEDPLASLWSVIIYSENSDEWSSRLKEKLSYVIASRRSGRFTDGVTYGVDLAVMCALDGLEFNAIQNVDLGWQPLRLKHDETRYLSGSLRGAEKVSSVIAAAAPRMGMAAAGALAAKMIFQFRPRYLALVGICAGRFGKVEQGDVLIADPVWDWGSGKIESRDDTPTFIPDPHQLDLDVDLRGTLSEMCRDAVLLAKVKASIRQPKPDRELRATVGPVASGASVIADKRALDQVAEHSRRLLGIEMEGYGVAVACQSCGKPRPSFVMIKGVSDYADKDKDDSFQEYAANASASVLFEMAKKFL